MSHSPTSDSLITRGGGARPSPSSSSSASSSSTNGTPWKAIFVKKRPASLKDLVPIHRVFASTGTSSAVAAAEERQQKTWFWSWIIVSAATLVLSIIQLLLCVHLLLDDTWSSLNAFVLQLVVWILIFLSSSGFILALMGMWIISYLIEAHVLLGVSNTPPPALKHKKKRGRRGTDEGPLLTDATTTNSSATSAPNNNTAAHDSVTVSLSPELDESIIPIHEDDEEDSEVADQTRGLRAALRDPNEPAAKQSQPPPPAVASPSFIVQVQQVNVVSEEKNRRSINRDEEDHQPISSASATYSQLTPPSTTTSSNGEYDNLISAYFNLSVLILILYFGFSLLLLAQRSSVADYVHTSALMYGIQPARHAHGIHHNYGVIGRDGTSSAYEDPEAAADVLKTQLGAYLSVMGVCALFSCKLISVATIASWQIQQKRPGTQQAYLTAHLAAGLWAAVLLACHNYILHHQTFVPLHSGEIEWLGVAGVLLFLCCLGGLFRFYIWSVGSPRILPLIRLIHMACFSLLTLLLFILSYILWRRLHQGPYYAHAGDPIYGSTPVRAIDVTESMWQLELAAQLKIAVLSGTCLVTAGYTAICVVVANQLDRILLLNRDVPTRMFIKP